MLCWGGGYLGGVYDSVGTLTWGYEINIDIFEEYEIKVTAVSK